MLSSHPKTILSALILALFCSSAAAQACKNYTFTSNANFVTCIDLPLLNSYLHWTYTNSTKTLQIAYRHTLATSTWTAWAINPTGNNMEGSQAFVAFLNTNGLVKAYTSPIATTETRLDQGDLSFPVGDVSGSYINGEITIFASLTLPDDRTSVNQLWQSGPVSNGNPGRHTLSGDNMKSKGTLDLLSGIVVATTSDSKVTRKNTHGILNVVSWGLMMPIGFMIARYLKVAKSADPAWFYLHASCQSAAFIIGLAGFATGIKLGNESEGIVHTHHRNIGITLVILATLQVLALFLRPKPDHKHRMKWSIYHHVVGYIVIILSIVNVFKGFGILEVAEKYRRAYIVVLSALAVVVVLLEIFTWIVVIKRRKEESGNGNAGRQQA